MVPQPGFQTPFVGRGAETAALDDVLARARAGDPRALLLAGDAGVGKSRLLAEAAARAAADGMTVLTGQCVDLGEVGLPYLPFTEILRTVAADPASAAILDEHPAVLRLHGAGGSAYDGRTEPGVRLRLLDDMAALLADLAEQAPLLLVLEDLHWADQSTRDLLRFLLSRLAPQRAGETAPHQRIALLVSLRSDDLHRRHPLRPLLAELVRLPVVARLDVGPLADAEVAELVRGLGSDPLPEDTVARIVERAEGNAFYAEELRAATADDAGVPAGLAEVLLVRIEQMPATAQRVLRTAAVAGRSVEHGLLRDAVELPDDDLDAALREAVGRHLLVSGDDGSYSFRHALTREAAYGDLLPGERVRLHAVFARLLGSLERRGGSAAERAHHHTASHDLPGALTASLEAAGHAAVVGAPAEELRHVEAALELWDAVPDAAELTGTDDIALTLRASAAAVRMGEAHRAVHLARAALDRVGSHGDTLVAAKVRYTLASSLMNVDSLHSAFEFSREALALIPEEPPSLTWAWAAATHVQAAWYIRRIDVVRDVGKRALAAAEKLGADAVQADVLISTLATHEANRQTSEGREILYRARDLARRAGDTAIELRAMYGLALGCFEAGLVEESLAWTDEGLDLARRTAQTSSPYSLHLRYVRALALYTLGRWDEALKAAGSAPSAFGHVAEGALYVPLGRGEPGVVDRAQALFDKRPFNWTATLVAGLVLVDEAVLRGDVRAAVDRFRRTFARLIEDDDPYPPVGVRLATLALSAIADEATALRLTGGDPGGWAAEAAEFAALAREIAARQEAVRPSGPEGIAWALRAEAEFARAEGRSDVGRWERVVAAFDYGNVYEHARCRLRLAEAYAAAGRRAEARDVLEAAQATAVALGATPLRAALDALARRTGLAAADSAAAAVAAGTLTTREQEVLRLLAEGRTNRQIGEALFISVKTASVHVSNILAKVGAASRGEAVAMAYRKGLIGPGPTER
ncbi:helix-turn-helix transcriptional regulator [Yinghuangia aomiensis]|uniref:Helix-turn-helix transcriptional regulator n=1 Tax=Yinghuangia aomiensis TaxID=676205 RepID=A0ABP9I7F4_9ACTN